jgi:hypothetical protein
MGSSHSTRRQPRKQAPLEEDVLCVKHRVCDRIFYTFFFIGNELLLHNEQVPWVVADQFILHQFETNKQDKSDFIKLLDKHWNEEARSITMESIHIVQAIRQGAAIGGNLGWPHPSSWV